MDFSKFMMRFARSRCDPPRFRSDVDQLLGVTKPETGAHSTEATVAQDWDKLTNGSGRMTVPQLTAALEAFFAARGNGAGV